MDKQYNTIDLYVDYEINLLYAILYRLPNRLIDTWTANQLISNSFLDRKTVIRILQNLPFIGSYANMKEYSENPTFDFDKCPKGIIELAKESVALKFRKEFGIDINNVTDLFEIINFPSEGIPHIFTAENIGQFKSNLLNRGSSVVNVMECEGFFVFNTLGIQKFTTTLFPSVAFLHGEQIGFIVNSLSFETFKTTI